MEIRTMIIVRPTPMFLFNSLVCSTNRCTWNIITTWHVYGGINWGNFSCKLSFW